MFNIDNTLFNIIMLIGFVVFMISLSLLVHRFNDLVQLVVIFSLIVIGFIADRVLLFYFRDYLKHQWYYFHIRPHDGSFRYQNELESIMINFGLIGGFIFAIVDSIVKRCKKYRKHE